MAEERFSLSVNLISQAVTQYKAFPFNSFSNIGDRYFGANEDGIFEIVRCHDADGLDIDSYFVLFKTDFNDKRPKQLRTLFVGYEASGSLIITITVDDECYQKYSLAPIKVGQKQHGNEIDVGNDLEGRYWEIKVESSKAFSIDLIEGDFEILGVGQKNTLR